MVDTYDIDSGETKQVISEAAAKRLRVKRENGEVERGVDDFFRVQVLDSRVKMSHDEDQAHKGREYRAGRSGNMRPAGKAVYAHAPNQDARVVVERSGFLFDLDSPIVTGSVLTSEENEVAPASDNFDDAHQLSGYDISGSGSVAENLNPPDRADQIVVLAEFAAAGHMEVTFEGVSGNGVTRTPDDNPNYSVGSAGQVFETIACASGRGVDISFHDDSGGSNDVVYHINVV